MLDKHRLIFSTIFMSCLGLLLFGYFLQFYKNIPPCPLCHLQRAAYYLLGILAFVNMLHNPRVIGRRIYSLGAIFFSSLGIITAGRQVWLQSLPPDQIPSCIPNLDIMLQYMPWTEALTKAFMGGGDCAKAGWSFLHLTIAQWSMAWFITFFILSFIAFFKSKEMPYKSIK